jgi:hypothetical protein
MNKQYETQYINMKNDDVNANPLTFKMYELKILHNMLVESLEEYPEFPMNHVILDKIKEEIKRTEIAQVVSAIFGNNDITPEDEEQNFWNVIENQYEIENNISS